MSVTDYTFHCITCGEPVHHTAQGWVHDTERDHPVAFTKPPWEVVKEIHTAEYPEVPDPEVTATSISPADPRCPGGAAKMLKGILKVRPEARYSITYSRGPRLHTIYGTSLGMGDSVLLRVKLPSREIVGMWEDGKFHIGYAVYRYQDTHTVRTDPMKSAALKEHILG